MTRNAQRMMHVVMKTPIDTSERDSWHHGEPGLLMQSLQQNPIGLRGRCGGGLFGSVTRLAQPSPLETRTLHLM